MAATQRDIVNMLDTDKHRIRRRRAFSERTQGFHIEEKPRRRKSIEGGNIKLAIAMLRKYRLKD